MLCGLLFIDLACVNGQAIHTDNQMYLSIEKAQSGLDATIGKDKSLFRVGSFPFGPGPNLEMYLGYQTIGGYTALFLHRYYEYINQYFGHRLEKGWTWLSYSKNENCHPKLMDLLNVKYEISHYDRTFSIRKTFLPRAFLVKSCKAVHKKDSACSRSH